jgi:ABC-2 type transport system permease protein
MSFYMKYTRVFKLGVQASLEYRLDFLFSLISAFFPIMIQYYIWKAVYGRSETGEFFGYSYGEMILYTIMAAIVTRIVSTNMDHVIASDIKNGSLNKHLIQPANYFGLKLFTMLGNKMFFFSVMIAILFSILYYFSFLYGISIHFMNLVCFISAMVMSLLLNFLISYTIAAIAFWLAEISYFFEMTGLFVIILSGGVFPIEVFGKTMNAILSYLPFKYTIYFPANVINGKLTMNEIVDGLLIQGFWIVIMLIISNIIWKIGLKKYLGLGG